MTPVFLDTGYVMNCGLRSRENDGSRKDAKDAKFGEMERYFSLRSWHPFDLAQDMLGAINFVKVVLLNI